MTLPHTQGLKKTNNTEFDIAPVKIHTSLLSEIVDDEGFFLLNIIKYISRIRIRIICRIATSVGVGLGFVDISRINKNARDI